MAVWSIPNPIIGNREPSALGNGGADTTFDDHAANRLQRCEQLGRVDPRYIDSGLDCGAGHLAAELRGRAGRGTCAWNIAAADLVDPLDHLFRDRGG